MSQYVRIQVRTKIWREKFHYREKFKIIQSRNGPGDLWVSIFRPWEIIDFTVKVLLSCRNTNVVHKITFISSLEQITYQSVSVLTSPESLSKLLNVIGMSWNVLYFATYRVYSGGEFLGLKTTVLGHFWAVSGAYKRHTPLHIVLLSPQIFTELRGSKIRGKSAEIRL